MHVKISSVLCVALGACSPPATPSVHLAPVHARDVAELPRRSPAALSYPTLENAGAETCRVGEAVQLGPHGEGDAVLAFDGAGGLAVWKPSATSLALQPLASDGTKSGPARSVEVPKGVTPGNVRALGDRFRVILGSEARAWSLVVDRAGGVQKALAPFSGPRVDAATHGRDAIAFTVTNAAVPLPSHGGTIYEPMGRPVFSRTHDGRPVGQPLPLEWHDNPIAYGMSIHDDIVWSGTHFLYPFSESGFGPTHDEYDELVLPIDCRPAR